MIFDVKMEDFRCKERLVADRNMTKMTKCQTYSSVVSRETIRIVLTVAALNDLQVKSGDITNAYVTAPITGKFWTAWVLMLARKSSFLCPLWTKE